VFATRLTGKKEKDTLILGTVLVYAGSQFFASSQVSNYGPIAGNANGREIDGFMTIDGAGNHPFHVNMPDLASGAFGTDTFGLQVWDVSTDSDPIFAFEGPLTTGDIQLLDLQFS